MNTAGIDPFSSLKGNFEGLNASFAIDAHKIDMLLHLLANLSQPILLLGEDENSKTAAFRQLQAKAHEAWTVCYIPCSANLSFERILDEMLRSARKPGQAWSDGTLETLFDEQHAALQAQGRRWVLLLDGAGILMPGLLGAICQFAQTHSAVYLAYNLTSADMLAKSRTDALAIGYAYVLELFSQPQSVAAAFKPADWNHIETTIATPEPVTVSPAESRRIAKGLWGLGFFLAALIAVAVSFYIRRPIEPSIISAQPKLIKPEASNQASSEPKPVEPVVLDAPKIVETPKPVEPKEQAPKSQPLESKAPPVETKPVDRFEVEREMDALIWKQPVKQPEPMREAIKTEAEMPAPRPVETAPAIKPPVVVENKPQAIEKKLSPEPMQAAIQPEPEKSISPDVYASMIKRVEAPRDSLSSQALAPLSEPKTSVPDISPQAPQNVAVQAAPIQDKVLPVAPVAPVVAETVKSPTQTAQTAQESKPEALDQQTPEGVNDVVWIVQQDPEAYTLQLVTVSRLNALKQLVTKAGPGNLATYRTRRNVYPVLYGVYPSLAEAQLAAPNLPFKLGTPIPRQFKSIQQEIQKAVR